MNSSRRLKAKGAKRLICKDAELLAELSQVAFSEITEVYASLLGEGGSIKSADDLTEGLHPAIESLVVEETFSGGGAGKVCNRRVISLRLKDKLEALELLGWYLGIFPCPSQLEGSV